MEVCCRHICPRAKTPEDVWVLDWNEINSTSKPDFILHVSIERSANYLLRFWISKGMYNVKETSNESKINVSNYTLNPTLQWNILIHYFKNTGCFCIREHWFPFLFFYMSLHSFIYLFFKISWRLITLQYCSGFYHTLTWISHGYTCIPHPDTPSHLPLHPIPLGLPSAPGPSTCLMHSTWAGDLFHPR